MCHFVSFFVAGAAFGEVHVSLFVAGAAFVKFMCHFLWQAQHLVKFMCHFSWQVQHVVKFGMIAGAGMIVVAGSVFNRICSWRVRKVALAARRVQFLRFLGRIILGSCSDHGRIGRALEMPLQLFSANFCQMLGGHFAWQAQYLVRLEGVDCCSAHCK